MTLWVPPEKFRKGILELVPTYKVGFRRTFQLCKLIIRNSQSGIKIPSGPFGAKPAWASAFINALVLLNAESLGGFTMPASASAFYGFRQH